MTRILFIPAADVLLWLESPDPPEELVHSVACGRWQPPAGLRAPAEGLNAYWQEGPPGLVIVTTRALRGLSAPPPPRLKGRRREILRMVLEGKTTGQIALRLKLHPRTVYAHIAALKAEFGAATRAELAAKARDL